MRFGRLRKVPQPLEAKVHNSVGMCLLVGRLQQQCMQASLPFPELLQALRVRDLQGLVLTTRAAMCSTTMRHTRQGIKPLHVLIALPCVPGPACDHRPEGLHTLRLKR